MILRQQKSARTARVMKVKKEYKTASGENAIYNQSVARARARSRSLSLSLSLSLTHTHTHTHTHTYLIVCLSVRGDLSFPTLWKRGRWWGRIRRWCSTTRRSPSVNRHLCACRKAETHEQQQARTAAKCQAVWAHRWPGCFAEYDLAPTTSLAPSSNESQNP